ncbi:MAG: hypothetical protein ABI233_06315 [Chthoniobacterales bacterium]
MIVTDFLKGGRNENAFQDFYKAPQTLYNTQISTPYMPAHEGSKAFHVSGQVKPTLWVVLYRSRVSPPETETYHFVGAGDDLLIVRFNDQVVLDGSWNPHNVSSVVAKYDCGFSKIPNKFVKGSSVSAKVGSYYPMEILIGEQPGGEFFADLPSRRWEDARAQIGRVEAALRKRRSRLARRSSKKQRNRKATSLTRKA